MGEIISDGNNLEEREIDVAEGIGSRAQMGDCLEIRAGLGHLWDLHHIATRFRWQCGR